MTPEERAADTGLAREKALTFLEYRDRTRREVQLRLRRYGFEAEVISEVCGWLEGMDLLNDRRFAERYAAEKVAAGWGARRIVSELGRKGVDRSLASRAASTALREEGAAPGGARGLSAAPPGVMAAGLVDMVVRRFGPLLASDPQKATRRAADFLARRGHEWSAIDWVVGEARRRVAGAQDAEGPAQNAEGPDLGDHIPDQDHAEDAE